MKGVLILLQLVLLEGPGLNTIAKINELKQEAATAFQSQEYAKAIESYKTLRDSFNVQEDALIMNLANSYYLKNDTASARKTYNDLVASQNKALRSQAFTQLGLLAHKQKQNKKALNAFKSALLANPQNEAARFNYELIKKLQAKRDQQQKDQQKRPEPSDYAKRLKEQASALAAQRKYNQAFNLMQEGLQQDSTLRAYMDFIQRLKNVSDIENQ